MAGLNEAARLAAMQDIGDVAPEEEAAPEGEIAAPAGDVEDALSNLEAFFDGAPTDIAQKAREMLNGLRQLTTEAGAAGGEAEEPPMEEVPEGDGGAGLAEMMGG